MQLIEFDSLDSTNDTAKRLIASGEIAGDACVIAREQTAGRGTAGRCWSSPKDAGLYMSAVLIDAGPIGPSMQAITITCGVACAEVLQERYGVAIQLKPVNDLILNGGKLGGILTEATIERGRLKHLIVGIGLNLRRSELSLPADAMAPAFLDSAATNPDTGADAVVDLATRIANRIERVVRRLDAQSLEAIRLKWQQRCTDPAAWPAS